MLVPLAVNGVMLLKARSRYPADVATAIASERALTPPPEATSAATGPYGEISAADAPFRPAA
ncbi:MAG TPA: hypothetical protein VMA77_03625 [Solirubrobacteraceae bacterium]|nr:hypothetical protein [Solirubrobacteraceae bacterium]